MAIAAIVFSAPDPISIGRASWLGCFIRISSFLSSFSKKTSNSTMFVSILDISSLIKGKRFLIISYEIPFACTQRIKRSAVVNSSCNSRYSSLWLVSSVFFCSERPTAVYKLINSVFCNSESFSKREMLFTTCSFCSDNCSKFSIASLFCS